MCRYSPVMPLSVFSVTARVSVKLRRCRGPSSVFIVVVQRHQSPVQTACMHIYGLVSASLAYRFSASLDPVPPRSRPPPAALIHTHTLPTRIPHHTKFS